MDADLDLLLTSYVTADDLLPERPGNARRRATDAEASPCVWRRRSWGSVRPTVLGGREQTLAASVPAASGAARVLQTPPETGRHAGVADGYLREPVPRLYR